MKNVLVVEPSPTMRLFIRMFLRGLEDINITEAQSGVECLEKLKTDRFDLLITDIGIPEYDGLQLIEMARKLAGSKMPIIILAPKGEQTNTERALSVGADYCVTKPIIGPTLTNLVINCIQTVK